MNPVIETIKKRRSIRAYEAKPVPRELLNAIIEAGNEAPSAMNSQPWRFVVIEDQAANKKLLGVLIVDDVITAGTAVRESIGLIRAAGASPAGVLVALDRQERGQGRLSAVQEVQTAFGIPVIRIITLDDLIEHLEAAGSGKELPALRNHRAAFGVDSEA